MENFVIYLFSFTGIGMVVFMLIKNMDIKVTLLIGGLVLMYIALIMGKQIAFRGFTSSGATFFDPIFVIPQQFVSTLSKAGFIILILGGYSSYMTKIGANRMTVEMLTRPLKHIKSAYILVPFVFLIGNFLSLVVPSASNLSIILLSTLYPILTRAGMSKLTAAGVIATTATIIPTPLGSDNIAIVEELRKTTEFADLTVAEYVFQNHAIISMPTLLFMAIVHYLWQKCMDKKYLCDDALPVDADETPDMKGFTAGIYALLPVLPILLLLLVYVLSITGLSSIEPSVPLATFMSFFIAIISDIFHTRSIRKSFDNASELLNNMGKTMSVVSLLVSASIFVVGLQSIGLIENLQSIMQSISVPGFVLPLILVLFTMLIVFLSGSGLALFFAMIPLMIPLATAANINPFAITLPMGLAGNLVRACSPVAGVILIVAGTIKESPISIIKRTVVPSLAGLLFMFILSMIILL